MIKKVVLTILVILWAGLIFNFSSQVATTSNSVSIGFTEKIINFLPQINNFSPEAKKALAESLNGIIRKYAHFSSYLVFGILVIQLVKCYNSNKLTSLIVALVVCLLYAISDEIHQIFVPGRACQWQDVLIDLSGSFTGCIIVIGVLKLNTMRAIKKPTF